ncbi:MAG: primosomal protein N' [Candidatus Cryptobacteroides sp.]
MDGKVFISVILPLKLEWEPCYWVAGMNDGVVVGDRIKVRFAGKDYVGIVSGVGVEPSVDPERVMEAGEVVAGMRRVLWQEIELWRQMAEYYMCSVGEVYKAAYPSQKVSLEQAFAAAQKRESERQVEKRISLTQKLESKIKQLRVRRERAEAVLIKREEMLGKARTEASAAKFEESRKKAELELSSIVSSISEIQKQLVLIKESGSDTQAMDFKPIISENGENNGGDGNSTEQHHLTGTVILTPAQNTAYESIKEAFSMDKPVLLNGVTGSGKTEIYIRLAQETLAEGQSVLYLVPEIALSRQLEVRLQKHFGGRMLIYHSGQTAVRKRNVASEIGSGKNYIVLGTRSAIFLPHNNLGLIIIDEEHDSSYKQDSPAPRYNGRDSALMLARIQGTAKNAGNEPAASVRCNVLMGSSTPSLEELYNCSVGRHALVRLSERFHKAENTEIELIDTRLERRRNGMRGNFSLKLIGRIQEVLQTGGQVLILRARRAWASAVQCTRCGEIQKCPHCNVSLSLHVNQTTGNSKLLCHYCGWSAPYTGRCGKCSGTLTTLGSGTQKIEEEAAALFPQARIARIDSDTARSGNKQEINIIQDFSEGKTDILVGTQIIAKGFDFSKLRLVAVIAADSLLGMQDFRADEKAMQLLEQFRGRCGRRDEKGRFVIQTSQPEHPLYQKIINNESSDFSLNLLAERKEFSFPPYTRIVEIQIKDIFEDRAERMAAKLADALSASLYRLYRDNPSLIAGPYTPMPDKLADNYLRMIRISLPKDRNLKKGKDAIMAEIDKFEKDNKYSGHVIINVDPS